MQTNPSLNFSRKILRSSLRLFFNLLYHQFAWAYDSVARVVSTGLWGEWVNTATNYLGGPRILELGYGPGHLQSHLASNSQLQSFGVDESRQMGIIAVRRLAGLCLPARLVIGDARKLPYPTAYFNQVVATFPSEYIFNPATLSEIRRVLTNEGTVIVLFQALITGKQISHKAASWLFRFTGQTIEQVQKNRRLALGPFQKAGFNADLQYLGVKNSTLVYIIAKIP